MFLVIFRNYVLANSWFVETKKVGCMY